MLSMMGIYLNDIPEKEYTNAFKLELLNQGQDSAVTRLKRYIMSDLDCSETDIDISTDGSYDTTDLTDTLYRGFLGIDGLRLTDGEFSHKISFDEFKKLTDLDRTFTTDFPVHYFRGDIVYVNPYEDQTIDIYYREELTTITNAVECALSAHFHEIILGLSLETLVDVSPAATRAYNKAMRLVEDLEDNYPPSDSIKDATFYNHLDHGNANRNFLAR